MRGVHRRFLAGCAAALAAGALGACGGTTPSPGGARGEGARVFAASGCGSCHAFGPAGTAGTAGPSLDDSQLTAAAAASVIRRGAAGMPAYREGLTDAEVVALARYVTGR